MASIRIVCRLACVLAAVALWQISAAPAWAAAGPALALDDAGLFEEPLVPTASAPSDDDAALAQAIAAYRARTRPDDTRALGEFLAAHPHSRWRLALLTNLGLTDYHYGYFGKAIEAFRQAWDAGRSATELHARALADRALGELLQMHARLGHADELAALLPAAEARGVTGAATEMVDGAKEGLWTMRHNPGIAYLCGPMALKNLLLAQGAKPEAVAFLDDYRSGPHGVTLAEVGRLADQAGLAHVLVHRTADQKVPVPSIIHWKVNHFAAIIGERDGRYRVVDPTFGSTLWVTRGAIDTEGSGDFLVPGSAAPAGLRPISATDATRLYGMGYTHSNSPGALLASDVTSQGNSTNQGCPLCGYSFKEMLVSLALADTPVGYTPPVGPAVRTTITYNQREMGQPANFSFYNVSPRWTLNWLSYIADDPTAPGETVVRNVGGGGEIDETGYNAARGTFTPETYDASVLTLTGPASYTRSLPDGSVETYAASNGATAAPRLIFLSKVTDPQGNAITLSYDAQLRLATITDAAGLLTRFDYADPSFPLQVTRITDPFGRFASLAYDSSGRLLQITDVLGLQSSFHYDRKSLVDRLLTPYGATNFAFGDDGNTRFLQATDPRGHTEMLMYEQNVPGVPQSDPGNLVPPGILNPVNQDLQDRDTFYWNKHAYAVAAGDVTKARIRHWAHLASDLNLTSDFIESEKQPLENRVWFNYPGQPDTTTGGRVSGTLNKPSRIGRVLDNGNQQLTVIGYNARGNPTSTTDPFARTTITNFYPNQIDVRSVQQMTGTGPVTIASYGAYDAGHRPSSFTDAAGQTTTYKYNAFEQLVQVTDPLGEQTRFFYDPQHRLNQVVNADGRTALSLTYDGAARVKTSTDSEGYTLTYGYDAADRVRLVTYPDGTTRQFTYTTLDLTAFTDRQNRTTQYGYDSVRDLIAVTDPLRHTTLLKPYENGVLETLVDADGNATQFGIDVQGRMTSKTYADKSVWSYAYEPATSRLLSVTDPLGQVKTYHYTADDRVANIAYANAINPTPDVVFGYDPYFPRRTVMVDGTGRTTYSYHPPGKLGALQLSSEFPPEANSRIDYNYDALGRLASRSVGGDAESFGYDPIGRLSGHADDLGSFKLAYLGETAQLTSRSNGVVATTWTYDTNLNDRKLIAIANKPAASAYQFPNNAPEGDIQGILDSFNGQTWTLGYDDADRLRTAASTAGTTDGYTLDPASNLDTIARPNGSLSIPPNALNQAIGVNRVLFSYDADGQLVQDASRKYAWDAENRLVGIGTLKDSSVVTTFRYDGLGRRIAIGTMQNGTTVETHYGWCGPSLTASVLCQSRTGADAPLRRYLAEGEVTPGENALDYYAVDQLGSVRDALDASTGASVAHYDYEWYGVRFGRPVASATDFRYAGLFLEQRSGLYLSATRAYDPVVGRWLSRDPIGEAGGVNLYGYVGGEPTRYFDPSGLWGLGVVGGSSAEGGIGVAGAGATASGGAGVFGKGLGGINTGSFASGGAFAGGPGYGVGFPGAQPGGATAAVGGFAGVGRGVFVTNATNAKQLSGPFNTYSLNFGIFYSFSIQFGISNGIGIFSVTFGPGEGFSLSSFPTTTTVIGGCGH